MGSSGKKKTTMAKFARENRLRERRLSKQAKRDARKQTSSDHPDAREVPLEGGMAQSSTPDPALADPEPTDPRAKEVALHRLRDAPDDELAVFEGKLQADALETGATEQEMRDAQRDHPGHDA
jgi:hypothetical protein